MTTEICLHSIVKVHAESGNGDYAYWVDVKLVDKKGHCQEITIFCETMLLAGLLAKSINEAQSEHDRIRTERARIAAEFGARPVVKS